MRPSLFLILLIIAGSSFPLYSSSTFLGNDSPSNVERLARTPTNSFTTLSVSPSNLTNLSTGSYFSIGIQVSNASSFFGWDISVQTDPSVIAPVSMNFTFPADLFEANFTATPTIVAECINGTLLVSDVCGTPYTPGGAGVAHLAAAVFPPPANPFPAPINGLLLNITYKVVASIGFSTIQILNNATLTNGSSQGIFPTLISGTYGTPIPYFSISTNPISPIVPIGSEGSASITLTSHYQFQGTVTLNLSVPSDSSPGILGAELESTVLTLLPDSTNSTTLLLNATRLASSSAFPITITGTSQEGPGLPFPISVIVQKLPYFELQITPALLLIHAGQTANSTVTLQSEVGFSGGVNFSLQAPTDLGVTATLGAENETIPAGGATVNTIIFVSAPITSLPFLYKINLTATGKGRNGPIYVTQQLIVRPPPVSLTINVHPSTVTVQAGATATATIQVTSVDYFWGFLYASAVMSGGAVGFNSSIYYIALPNSPHASYAPMQNIGISLKIDPSTPPGNYVALLTIYSLQTSYQRAFSTQVPIQVSVVAPAFLAANQVFGLPALVYFIILGALVVPLVFFSVQTYRRREKEDEDWRK